LILSRPEDYIDLNTGIKFWTTPKRFPHVLKYDSSNPVILDYIYNTSNLFAYNMNMPKISRSTCKELCDKMKASEYK